MRPENLESENKATPAAPSSIDLIGAARRGDLKLVYQALVEGQSIHQTNAEGKTSLHEAILHLRGKIAKVSTKYLLDAGADPEARDRLGRAALHMACIAGDYDVVELLLSRGSEISAVDNNGNKAIHFATANASPDVLNLLLVNGTGSEDKNLRGDTPLHCAAKSDKVENVKFLLDYGVNPNSVNVALNTPLHEASFNQRDAVVRVLLAYGANEKAWNKRGETAAHLAIACPNVLSLLLVANPDLANLPCKITGDTPLHKAVTRNAAEAVFDELMKAGAKSSRNRAGLLPQDCVSSPQTQDLFENKLTKVSKPFSVA